MEDLGKSTQSLFEQLLEELQENWTLLPDKPEETPQSTVRALLALVPGDTSPVAVAKLRDLVRQRKSGVPLAHLTGRQSFMGLEFLTSPEALIPRKETEILTAGAIEVLHEKAGEDGTARVIDLCCGCGNVALSLAHFEDKCTVTGSDISQDCINLACRNAVHLGLSDRATFVQSDLLEAFENAQYVGNIDLITCNPPYISTAKVDKMAHEISGFEPRLAFDGGPFGVNILTRLVRVAPRFLRRDGYLAFEVGLGQGSGVAKMIIRSGAYSDVRELRDSAGEIRCLIARNGG